MRRTLHVSMGRDRYWCGGLSGLEVVVSVKGVTGINQRINIAFCISNVAIVFSYLILIVIGIALDL